MAAEITPAIVPEGIPIGENANFVYANYVACIP